MPPTTPPPDRELVAPLDWPWALATPPTVSSDKTSWQGALIRSWSGTSPVMEQPPLDHHYVVMHLGGAKRVNRMRDGPPLSTLAENGSLTIVPAGTAYVWRTEGPIAFAHVYVAPRRLERFAEEVLERDGLHLDLFDSVGCRDHVLEPVLKRMLDELQVADPSKLLLDSLLESFCIRLARRHASAPVRSPAAHAESLAPHRLRRVLEFIDANLGADIALADLVQAAGTSQYHFSRAFHLATGFSPYRYVIGRRIEYASALLIASNETLAAISAICGFNSQRQFAVMFKRTVGVGPKRFRLEHTSP